MYCVPLFNTSFLIEGLNKSKLILARPPALHLHYNSISVVTKKSQMSSGWATNKVIYQLNLFHKSLNI